MDQAELLQLITDYNNTDRKTIKTNLKRIMEQNNITPGQIINLGYAKNNVYAWTNQAGSNIPMFDQALHIATAFNFDVKEFLR